MMQNNPEIALRVLPVNKNAMNQFYLHQMQLSRAKLKASSRTSALLAGFAMVALVEINLNGNSLKEPIPAGLITAFGICTTLLVAVHLLALLISTCLLPHVEAVANTMHSEALGAQMASQKTLQSPHQTMHLYIETAWVCSTLFGILLFLIEIGLLCWIQFNNSQIARVTCTVLLVPIVLVFFFFAFQFYRKLVKHNYKNIQQDLDDIRGELNMFSQGGCIQEA